MIDPNDYRTETTMPEPPEFIDDLERVTISSDGGVGGRGRTSVVYVTHEVAQQIFDEAHARRRA